MSLADTLERAASELAGDADDIRPANGDPIQLLSLLDREAQGRVLGWLLLNEPESGEELAVAWAEEPEGEQPLLALDSSNLPKAGRKALRRALHRLRSRGVAVEKAAAREPVVARLPAIEDDFEMGFVSSVDPRGARVVYLVEPNPSGGARLFEVLIDELRGIVDFELYAAGRSKVREFIKRLRSRQGWLVVEAPPASVRALIVAADARQPADRPCPRGFVEWRSHLAQQAAEQSPGAELAAASDQEVTGEALDRVAHLVRDGELGPWPPDSARLQQVAELIREQAESKLIVSGARSAERLEQAVQLAAADLFSDDFAEATAVRFEETAYVLSRKDRSEDAVACLGAALAFRTRPAGENPVAQALLEESLGSFLQSLRDKEEDGDAEGDDASLIVER